MALEAATRSSTSAAKLVLSGPPPLWPMPAKSNLRTPMPALDRARAMRTDARLSFPQVKQWANIAQPRGVMSGASSLPESR
jgi:hypothetical protein